MRKKIISNTILFIIIISFVKIFEAIFGAGNSLVGVTVIIAILVLMQEDLTKNPFENFIKLLLLNISLGIFAHISSNSIWLGLILNFVVMSGIGYLLSYNMTKVILVPFGLQYLFMLYTPVSGEDFSKRLIGLGFGAVLIMTVQLLIHKKNNNNKVEESKSNEYVKEKDNYSDIEIFGKKYKFHRVRGAYAIRIGLLTAITAFIVAYLNLQQGRWIVYTIFSLTELYSENCRIRSKQRLEGTIIGSAIILVLFMVIKSNTIRGLLVLVGGYLDSYTSNYRDKMICVTMSVVASTSLTNGALITATQRIGCVFIGVILALIVDKLVLRKKSEDFELVS